MNRGEELNIENMSPNKMVLKELSLYVHIPFCAKKCDYCDFLSAPASRPVMERYKEMLVKEILSSKGYEGYKVRTVFIGGGTPSIIDGGMMKEIVEALYEAFYIEEDAEISIEINPGTMNKEKLAAYKEAGINRLSFGLQSAHDEELKLLGRIHSYEDFRENFLLARELGFTNINVDLMSGLPKQSLADWLSTLEEVTGLNPSHISAYSLIVEEDTFFYSRYSEDDLDEELDRVIYEETRKFLEQKGYLQYEISNYAKQGYECKHNIVYWTRKDYLGFGIGSASLIGNIRYYNERDINTYIKNVKEGIDIKKEVTELSLHAQMEEFMFLGLRMNCGVSVREFESLFETSIYKVYGEIVEKTVEEGLLVLEGDYLRLTDKGIDLSNVVMSKFLF